MKAPLGVFLVVAVAASSVCVQSQTAEKNKAVRPRGPELEVKVIPSKETYALHEDVFTKTEFLNLTDKTLCFPEPAQPEQIADSGYVTATAAPVDPHNNEGFGEEFFIDHYASFQTWPREKLRSEIEQSWVKLAPNQVYVTKSTRARMDLRFPGYWQFKATYNPPECSYNFAECTRYRKSAAESVGCTVPEMVVTAEPVTVNVVPSPEPKQSIK